MSPIKSDNGWGHTLLDVGHQPPTRGTAQGHSAVRAPETAQRRSRTILVICCKMAPNLPAKCIHSGPIHS